jgi:hypothetical protein
MFGRAPALSTPYCSGPAPCKPRSIYRTNYISHPDRIQSGPVIQMDGTAENIERGYRMSFAQKGTTHHSSIVTTEYRAWLPRRVHGPPTSSNFQVCSGQPK